MRENKIKIGNRYGRLVVLKEVEPAYGRQMVRRYLCQCDCGNTKIVRYNNLLVGGTKSCGCLVHDVNSSIRKYTLKQTSSRLYTIWNSIKGRCYVVSCGSYKDYGAKGISMCDEWKEDYISFYNWAVSNGYSDELTIDRIDYTGNYEPSNCRWVSYKEQANNKSSNVLITFNGITHTLSEWCGIVGIKQATLNHRINKAHWPIEKALTTPVQTRKQL